MGSDRSAFSKKRDCQHCVYSGCVREGRAGRRPEAGGSDGGPGSGSGVTTLTAEGRCPGGGGCPLAELAGALLCMNRPEAPGRPVLVDPGGSCRNFRRRRERAVWTVPPEPPNDEIRYIPLTKGLYAIVDAADYEWLSKYKWTALIVGDKAYAIRSHKGKTILMHREIMQPPPGMVVDHINGVSLNNRRCNLRVCTPLQNRYNSRPRPKLSPYKGVRFDGGTGKWTAEITHEGVKYHLGTFAGEVEAARAYDRRAVAVQGPYARLNFPHEQQAAERQAGGGRP